MTGRRIPVLTAMAVVFLTSAVRGAENVPVELRAAVSAYATESQGYLVYDRHRTQSLTYPGHSEMSETTSMRLRTGTRVLAVRIKAGDNNGVPLDAAAIAKQQAQNASGPWPEAGYDLPLQTESVGDFTYATQACAACEPGVIAIGFRANKRGEQSADGTIFLLPELHRIVKVDFVPVRLPKPSTQGACTLRFGDVGSGLWQITRTEMHFSGRQLFVLGHYDILIAQDHYRRYDTEREARADLSH